MALSWFEIQQREHLTRESRRCMTALVSMGRSFGSMAVRCPRVCGVGRARMRWEIPTHPYNRRRWGNFPSLLTRMVSTVAGNHEQVTMCLLSAGGDRSVCYRQSKLPSQWGKLNAAFLAHHSNYNISLLWTVLSNHHILWNCKSAVRQCFRRNVINPISSIPADLKDPSSASKGSIPG
jgi:hypothetical protein